MKPQPKSRYTAVTINTMGNADGLRFAIVSKMPPTMRGTKNNIQPGCHKLQRKPMRRYATVQSKNVTPFTTLEAIATFFDF